MGTPANDSILTRLNELPNEQLSQNTPLDAAQIASNITNCIVGNATYIKSGIANGNDSFMCDNDISSPLTETAVAAVAAAIYPMLNQSATDSDAIYHRQTQLLRHDLGVNTLLCAAYAAVFFVGVLGNSCVVAVVHRCQRMHSATNYFIANLALADILVLLFCLPATLVSNIFSPWIMGRFMCKAVSYVQGVSVSASVNSLVAVSMDRCLAICWGLKCRISNKRARTIIILIWTIPALIMLPWPLYFELRSHSGVVICQEVWPDHLDPNLFFLLANLIFCYLLPLIVITISYIGIWIKVSRRDIPSDTKDIQLTRIQRRSKFKVVKMLLVVVIVFTLSWLPLYTFWLLVKFIEPQNLPQWLQSALPVAVPLAQWLGASNSCINPVLYAFFNKKYRLGFQALIHSGSCCTPIRIDLPVDSTVRRPANYQRHLADACQAAIGGDTNRVRRYKPTRALLATSIQIGVGVSQSGMKPPATGV